MIDWTRLGEAEFNRIAEALIRRKVMTDNPGVDVKALDGRGGDGGIDLDAVVTRTGHLIAIYQLKWFPEGFSGAWAKARKPQITKSFNSALRHDPPAWYLVVPRNLTPKERTFVRSLQDKRPRPLTRYIGAGELDDMLVRFPDIEEWAQRDPTRRALEIVARESAALAKPGDLAAEVRGLAARTSIRSDYWEPQFSWIDNVFTEELVPKRPDAHEREPLHLTLSTDFTDHEALGAQYRDALEYGVIRPIELPSSVITSLHKEGPEWFAELIEDVEVELHPSPTAIDIESKITLLRDDGGQLAQRNGVGVKMASGIRGGQVEIDLGGGLVIRFVLEHENKSGGSLNMDTDLRGLSGTDAKRSLKFLTQLARADLLKLEVAGHEMTVRLGEHPDKPEEAFVQFTEDLAYLEDELAMTFVIPDVLPSALERIWTRVARRILEGDVSAMPNVNGFNFELSGELDEGIEKLLTSGGAVRGDYRDWEIKVLGERVVIQEVSFAILSARVEGAEAHLEALRAGTAQDRKVHVGPADGTAAALIWGTGRVDPNAHLAPKPWGLSGVLEHRQLREDTPPPAPITPDDI